MSVQIDVTYTVDLLKPMELHTMPTLLFTEEEMAHRFLISVTRGAEKVSLSGAEIKGYFIRGDNATHELTGSVDEQGRAVVVLDKECYAASGRVQLAILAAVDGAKSVIFAAEGGMHGVKSDSILDPDNIVPSLSDLLAQIEKMEQATADANAAAKRANEAADNAGGGTGGGTDNRLPQVTEADEGMPLRVENGEYKVGKLQKNAVEGLITDLIMYGETLNKKAEKVHADQHRSGDTLTWDGVVTDQLVVPFDEELSYVHMSYATPSWAMLYGKASCAWTIPNGTNEFIADDDCLVALSADVVLFGFVLFAANDNASYTDENSNVVTFPKKGIYFGKATRDDGDYYISRLTVPGYAIGGGFDPITPEMIGAAQAVHADQHRFCDTLTWDGDITKYEVYDMGSNGGKVAHLSDKVLTTADLANGFIITKYDEDEGPVTTTYTLDDAFVNADGAMMLPDQDYIFVIPSDNYRFKEFFYSAIFPKAGVYLFFEWYDDTLHDGGFQRITIPGYNFTDSTDPITPEMIYAAPEKHASVDPKYGMANYENFGHVKLIQFPLVMDEESGNWNDPNGNFVATGSELASGSGLAASAFAVSALNMVMTLEFASLNERISTLEQEIAALKG